MAKLLDTAPRFTSLYWPDRVKFVEEYRAKRARDIAAGQDFNLAKQAKSTKAREKKVKDPNAPKRVSKAKTNDKVSVTHEQLSLLRALGMNI